MTSDMHTHPPFRLRQIVVAVSLVAFLSACGGGGGSKGGTRPDDPDVGVPTNPATPYSAPTVRNPDRLLIPNGAAVRVSVVDSPINNAHPELEGRIAGYLPTSTGPQTFMSGPDANHGTAVAARIAGNTLGYAGNAELLVTAGGVETLLPTAIRDGHIWAINNGARVLNMSHLMNIGAFMYGYKPMFEKLADIKGFAAIAAGNDNANLSKRMVYTGPLRSDAYLGSEGRFVVPYTLWVGSTDPHGNKAFDSAYPGEHPELQARFLMAPGQHVPRATGDGGYSMGSGTSFATPVVAAGAATVMSLWPHLEGDQVADLLLNTASKRSPLYAQNNCGENAATNCGFYYFGQGELDMGAALAPSGDLAIPAGQSVTGASFEVAQSSMLLSSAFGDAGRNLDGLQVAAFDAIGRDYGLKLSSFVRSRSTDVSAQMFQLFEANVGQLTHPEQRMDSERMSMRLQYGPDGSVRRMQANGHVSGGLRWLAYSRTSHQPAHAADIDALSDVGLLSLQSTEHADAGPRYRSGMSFALPVHERVTLRTTQWVDHGLVSLDQTHRGSAWGSQLNVGVSVLDGLRLHVGAGAQRESDSIMGSIAKGSLALGDAVSTRTVSFGADYRASDRFNVFARHEAGRIDGLRGSGMIREFSSGKSTETLVGVSYSAQHWNLAAVMSQPLRVHGAEARLHLPVGRTLDGEVVTDTHTISLSPSGRQRNLEIAFSRPLGDNGAMSANLLRIEQPGHSRHAKPEHAVMVQSVWRF